MNNKALSILLLFLYTVIISCSQTTKQEKQKEPIMNNISEILREKQITYGIETSMFYPYELYINDIKADFSPNGGNTAIEINPYVLKNGKYKIKLKLFPYKEGELLSPKEISENYLQFSKVIKKEGGVGVIEREHLENLKVILPITSVAYFEQEWGVELTELPYELEGWSKGQDLSKMDKKVLEEKVVGYYQRLWKILNDGNVDEWLKKDEKRRDETYIFNYTASEEAKLTSQNNSKKISKNAKNNMQKIENYQFVFYAQSRIISLERIDKENKGEGVLRTLEPDGAVRIYNIKLYLPEGSNEFVIIRK